MASPAVDLGLHGRHRTTYDSGSQTPWKPTQGKLELRLLPFSRGGRLGAERIGWDHEDGVLHASLPLSAGINMYILVKNGLY